MNDTYVSPFSGRYTSPEMSALFSPRKKVELFRKLWIALAKAQKNLGLPISEEQIQQMEASASTIDFATIQEYEKKFRHDVMAHIHAYGDLCPKAKPIIHLGATSCYVTDNADLIQLKEALQILLDKLLFILSKLADLSKKHAADPTLSYTHFQPAQPTTIGKRFCLYLQDFMLDAKEWIRLIDELPFLGAKGATGTQASFLSLFEGDHKKIQHLEKEIATSFGFKHTLPISGQTYTRKLDIMVLNTIESFAASAHKFATDIRLLAHEGEFFESFGEYQVGSSAMPYKRNPIYSERICGLSRFAMSLSQNPAYTTATQWLERTLDDSSNRRLAIPESFLCADAILNLMAYVLTNPKIQTDVALANVQRNLSHLCMENILMESVKRGGHRQELHEKLRKLSSGSLDQLKSTVEKDPEFHLTREEIETASDPKSLTGCSEKQVIDFLQEEVHPFLQKYPGKIKSIASIEI